MGNGNDRKNGSDASSPEEPNWVTEARVISWLAWRFIKVRRAKAGLSFMSTLSIGGVTLGVAVLVIVLSVMGGFEADLKSRLLDGLPHVEFVPKQAGGFISLRDQPIATILGAYPQMQALQPFVQTDVVIKQRKHLSAVTLFGVDPAADPKIWGFTDNMVDGSLDALGELQAADDESPRELHGIILGENLAVQLGAERGDIVHLISPNSTLGGASGHSLKLTQPFVVVGRFSNKSFNYDSKWAVTTIAAARRYLPDYDTDLDAAGAVSGFAGNLADPMNVEKLKPLAEGDPLKILTWQTRNTSILFALKLEKFTMGSILMLIVVVAAFSISGTLMMMVFYRRKQLGVLRAIGMSRPQVARLFLGQGIAIGTVGIVLGLALGLAACGIVTLDGRIPLPGRVYYLKWLPVRFLPLDYAVICVSAWILSLVASVYPALTAARHTPSAGLRYE